MFGIGFVEIAAICIVALIFIRPRDLPRVIRKLGRLYRNVSEQLIKAKRVIKEMESGLDDNHTDNGEDITWSDT